MMSRWLRQRLDPATAGWGKWLFCLVVAVCALAFTYWPSALPLLRYDRVGLLAGEGWRLLTAHLVHLSGSHLLLNLLGLFLICELLWGAMPARHGIALLTASALGVCALLWWRHPELAWYVGLSGALHGLWAGCALTGLCSQNRKKGGWLAWPLARSQAAAGLLLLVVKLLWEWQSAGAGSITVSAAGLPVVTDAHWYGALSGMAWVVAARLAGWALPGKCRT